MTGRPLRVLALDIEGGFGGSSRSLFESLRHMDCARVAPEVWCRRPGPIQPRYADIGIPCRVEPEMPKVSSLPRLSRNLYVHARAWLAFRRCRAFCERLAAEAQRHFDLVHFNHEALWMLARWLRPRVSASLTMHVRTIPADTSFARRQMRTIAETVDRAVFITEHERDNFRRLAGRDVAGAVIYNIAPMLDPATAAHPGIPRDGRLKIASLSNYAWIRGTDRLVDIASALADMGRRDVLFVVAGNMSLPGALPGELGRIGRRGGTLADFAARRGVSDMFLFLGHVDCPEGVLVGCDVLVKPSREDNPWGRDIIEAMAAGKPVVATGTCRTFVETGETGMLQPLFDAAAMARAIVMMADDRTERRRLGEAARRRAAQLCNGPDRAAELLAVWEQTVRRGPTA